MFKASKDQPRVFESVSRRTYWIGVGSLTAVLIGLSIWANFYAVQSVEEDDEVRITTDDPMMEILYSPVGNAVVLLVLQFLAANLLFWVGAWVWLRVKR